VRELGKHGGDRKSEKAANQVDNVAEHEAQMISHRIKAALSQSTKSLGGDRGKMHTAWPESVAVRQRKMRERKERQSSTVCALRSSGMTLVEICAERAGRREDVRILGKTLGKFCSFVATTRSRWNEFVLRPFMGSVDLRSPFLLY
jgi:hypothetical protein